MYVSLHRSLYILSQSSILQRNAVLVVCWLRKYRVLARILTAHDTWIHHSKKFQTDCSESRKNIKSTNYRYVIRLTLFQRRSLAASLEPTVFIRFTSVSTRGKPTPASVVDANNRVLFMVVFSFIRQYTWAWRWRKFAYEASGVKPRHMSGQDTHLPAWFLCATTGNRYSVFWNCLL